MNLRFVIRDGAKILQHEVRVGSDCKNYQTEWRDIPLVEEPRKPREWWIEPSSEYRDNGAVCRVWPADSHMLIFTGEKPDMSRLIKVREVLDETK